MKYGPVVIVDDDDDDVEILKSVVDEIGFEGRTIHFQRCDDAFQYLLTTSDQPFLIICDVNLPGKDGIKFKKEIDDNPYLRNKSIPFVFYTTYVDPKTVKFAYTEMTVQGFFKKGSNYSEIKKNIKLILNYWKLSSHPNSV